MTELQTHSPQDLIEGIARGYAAEATPPLTPELSETLRTALRGIGSDLPKGEPLDEAGVGRINEALTLSNSTSGPSWDPASMPSPRTERSASASARRPGAPCALLAASRRRNFLHAFGRARYISVGPLMVFCMPEVRITV